MMARVNRVGVAFASVALLWGASAAKAAVGTEFIFQGQLKDGGVAYSGLADFRFAVFDACVGGVQVGPTLTQTNVTVDDGLFTVTLNFGPGVFTGAARCLSIQVRVPAGAGGYVPIAPRQPLSPSPYSIAAGLAETVAPNSVDSGSIVNGSIQLADLSFTPGDITAVNAGSGLSGGGASG